VIVTTNGSDGAASAALLLRLDPGAEILTTSAARLPETLRELAGRETAPNTVHLCGVGLDGEPGELMPLLETLADRGAALVWYCGRGYLDPYAETLSPHCRTAFVEAGGNAGAVAAALGDDLARDARTELLLELGREYARREDGKSQAHRDWHALMAEATSRYFRFGDRDAYPRAIRQLAGLLPVTGEELRRSREATRSGPLPVGNSRVMKRLRERIAKVAPSAEPVLVLGPSGSGKELVARAVHAGSARAEKIFLPINCATLASSHDLAHDRLFGHVKGAYTGATHGEQGAFEAADGGTLFLDEVAELPLGAQTNLLRVLEEGRITPLGTQEARTVDVRLIAATNQDLRGMIAEKRFREDLFHRLNILVLPVPALVERREDMRSIARSVLHELAESGLHLKITEEDWGIAEAYDWPGNVRQLRNLIKRAAILGESLGAVIAEERQAGPLASASPDLALFRPARAGEVRPEAEIRSAYARHVLGLFDGNRTRAAEALGISPNTLRARLEEASL